MAALGAQSIASSYEQLLHVDADGGGNSTTHVSVKDGDTGTTAVTCGAGSGVFVAIQFIEDTVFASGSGGLIAETEQLFPDDAGTGTLIDANGGAAIDGETFPQGMTIYGRFTGFTLASGACLAYVG